MKELMKQSTYKKLFGIIITSMMLLPGCFWKSESTKANKSMLYVVNVLSKDLYDDAHIKGSIHVDLDDLDTQAEQWNKDATVVVYCSNYQCTASSYAAKNLKKAGFKHVFAYEGGMAEWYHLSQHDANYQVEGPAVEDYLKGESEPLQEHEGTVDTITASALNQLMQKATVA